MCTQSTALQILQEVHELSKEVFLHDLKDSILYGSYARGDYDHESDVDILLTVSLDTAGISAARRKIAKISSDLSLKHDVTVSVTVKPLAQFEAYAHSLPFYRNVLKEGIRYVS